MRCEARRWETLEFDRAPIPCSRRLVPLSAIGRRIDADCPVHLLDLVRLGGDVGEHMVPHASAGKRAMSLPQWWHSRRRSMCRAGGFS